MAYASLAACSDSPLPGTLLGTYTVTEQIQSNSCGLAAPSSRTFDAQLSETPSASPPMLYWSWLDGSAAAAGPLSSPTSTLTWTEQVNVDGTSDGVAGPCTLERDDTFQLTLAAPPSSFTGSISYAISAVAGSNCSDQLTASGGSYTALPCTITSTLTATRQ
jgi:hypothetical protein